MSRTKVLQRRRDVASLLVRGIAPGEIAEILEVTRQTVYNDVRVIRSGKNDALFAHTRMEIIAQLYLNAQERMKYLWRLVEEAEKNYVKVQALRELRLNDERITGKLPEPGKDSLEQEEDESDGKAMLAQYQNLYERVELMRKRREGMQRMLKEHLESGDMEGLRAYLHDLDLTAGDKNSQ